MEQLDGEKFPKLMGLLERPGKTIGSGPTHHVGADQPDVYRFLEKVRYKWRRRTLVRFAVLTLEPHWERTNHHPLEGDQSLQADRTRHNRR